MIEYHPLNHVEQTIVDGRVEYHPLSYVEQTTPDENESFTEHCRTNSIGLGVISISEL